MTDTIQLIPRTYDHKTKCAMCGFRYHTLYNFNKTEEEELAACSSCTVEILVEENYVCFQTPDDGVLVPFSENVAREIVEILQLEITTAEEPASTEDTMQQVVDRIQAVL